jgi:hypothetical protein
MPLLTATGRVLAHMRRSLATTALATAALATGISAPADAGKVKDLWATVNVCDTPKSPNKMGVRARMPGDGTTRRMFMRFTAQYRTGGKWKVVGGRGRSGWLLAGSARFRNQELGYTFSIDAPKPGTSYVLRGLVQFQWRKKGTRKVERRSHRFTERGHPTGRDGQPRNYSAARCRISTPAPANP